MKAKVIKGSVCGKFAILIGVLVGFPIVILPFYPQEYIYIFDFLIPAIGSIIFGLLLCALSNPNKSSSSYRQSTQIGSLTVLFVWVYGVIIGALPFIVSGQIHVVGALFEAVSGWTTTGLSVMDVSTSPYIFLFHRAFMQFCGGLGFVMMMVMFIQGKNSMSLYNAEGHPDKLMPNLKKTAQTIFMMYVTFLIVGSIVYTIFGSEPFDSITNAMCALSTGGFSIRLGSIGEYNSVSIEIITIILMIIGTTNFAVLLLAAKGKWKQVFKVSEVRFMGFLLVGSTIVLTLSLMIQMNMGFIESLRRALVDGVSAFSTTGFSSMSYTTWPPFATGVLTILMLIGGGIGSTAGGIKMTRVYLMYRVVIENITKRIYPSRKISSPQYYRAQGKTAIESSVISDTAGFIAIYLFIYFFGSLLLTITASCSLSDAMFEFASSIGTVGLSIGITNPMTNNPTLIIEMIGMLLGRLEIFVVFTGMHSGYSIIKHKLRHKTI